MNHEATSHRTSPDRAHRFPNQRSRIGFIFAKLITYALSAGQAAPDRASLDGARPCPIITCGCSADPPCPPGSASRRAGRPGDAAVLQSGELHRLCHRRETRLAHCPVPAHHAVTSAASWPAPCRPRSGSRRRAWPRRPRSWPTRPAARRSARRTRPCRPARVDLGHPHAVDLRPRHAPPDRPAGRSGSVAGTQSNVIPAPRSLSQDPTRSRGAGVRVTGTAPSTRWCSCLTDCGRLHRSRLPGDQMG